MQFQIVFSVLFLLCGLIFLGCGEPEPIVIGCEGHPVGLTTTMIGRTEYGSLYRLGTVLVSYEEGIQTQTNAGLTAPVKDFY